VVVLGSANLDAYAQVPAIPAPGETVLADGPEMRTGGKGLNQAVAAARAGASTVFLGAVGGDDAARLLLDEAETAGIDTSVVRRVPGPSGTAWIILQADGENSIVVLGAANRSVTTLLPRERDEIARARVLVLQLETPMSAVVEAAAVARAHETTVVLNASPVGELGAELLGAVDVLVVNEHEASQIGGGAEPEPAATGLLEFVGAVVVTLGADGALIVDRGGRRHIAGVPARAIDTTGAGDTFAGVLAATLASDSAAPTEPASLDRAVARAVVAGAIAVEHAGAVAAIPTAAAIDARLRDLGGAR